MAVAYVDCSSKEISCSNIGFQSATIYLPLGNDTLRNGIEIHSLNYLEIATQILRQLPEAELVDEESLEVIVYRSHNLEDNFLTHFSSYRRYVRSWPKISVKTGSFISLKIKNTKALPIYNTGDYPLFCPM